jgi:hypothetical protein
LLVSSNKVIASQRCQRCGLVSELLVGSWLVPSLCWPNPGGWAKASGAVKIEPESQREHFDYNNRSEKVSIEEMNINEGRNWGIL